MTSPWVPVRLPFWINKNQRVSRLSCANEEEMRLLHVSNHFPNSTSQESMPGGKSLFSWDGGEQEPHHQKESGGMQHRPHTLSSGTVCSGLPRSPGWARKACGCLYVWGQAGGTWPTPGRGIGGVEGSVGVVMKRTWAISWHGLETEWLPPESGWEGFFSNCRSGQRPPDQWKEQQLADSSWERTGRWTWLMGEMASVRGPQGIKDGHRNKGDSHDSGQSHGPITSGAKGCWLVASLIIELFFFSW